MSTIVCLRKQTETMIGTDEFVSLDIVDGQQRLTTLILLLNEIKLALEACDQNRVQNDLRKISELLVKPDSKNLILLQTNHDSSHFFNEFICSGKRHPVDVGKTLADREILKAIQECKGFLNEWRMDVEQLLFLYSCIKNRLFFVLYQITEERLVYSVFEVLNSRGISVSSLDKLKSILMGAAYELPSSKEQLILDLKNIWRDIYTTIGLHQGLNSESLRFAATLYQDVQPSKPLSETDAVSEFRNRAVGAESIRTASHWLLEVTKACNKVFADPRRNAITKISQARLLAVAIHLKKDIGHDDKEKILTIWEKVTFRIYGMLRKDARTQVGNYVRLSWRILNEDLTVEKICDEIKSIGEDFPIDVAIKSLQDSNCYEGWQEELRYFMFRYEEYLSGMQGQKYSNEQWERIWIGSAADSIEHIWPQSDASEDIKHNLGNLVVLPPSLNSQLKDLPPKKKFGKYEKTGLYCAIEVPPKTGRWSKSAVRERRKKLLEWAAEEWGG